MSVLFGAGLLAVAVGLVGLDGQPVQHVLPPGSRAVVLFFAASDCPLSNRYLPEIERLSAQYGASGIRFWIVYPNPQESTAELVTRNRAFAVTVPTVLDTRQTLVHWAHATVTPEAAILIPREDGPREDLREVYRGRVDNRYLALGAERPQATHHDLEDALRAVVAGRPVPQPGGPPVGCAIVSPQP